MKLHPTIFLSGVSSEFGSFRDAVEIEVQKKGCFAENQSSFGVDYRTVEEMLRRRINDADAVIHIVGFRFGAEPKDRPADKPRRSYTQIEHDIARELKKPVYLFLSTDTTVGDSLGTDDAEAIGLQLAHRQAIQESNSLFYFFKDKAELCKLVGEVEAVARTDFRVDISRIDRYAPSELIGREQELALLNDAWLKVRRAESKRPHILTFVALGGEGKTSLIAKWLAELAFQNWPGCDSAFAWSFYSQGTREQYASSDLFLKEAIIFFGDDADKEFAGSAAGAYEKGQRLASIVGQRRALLILDGLEPLQYAPTSPTSSELKDAGIAALLKGLAAHSNGLCIVTTRYSVPNLKAFRQATAPEILLNRLSQSAGVHLLKNLGVNGSPKELDTLVEDVKGHALTLNLLGTYLYEAHGGDIRRRDLIKLEEADAEEQGGHAFRVMEAYERAFEREGDKGKRALAILRLLGLFDRPVSADCLAALLEEPIIPNLTDPLVGSTVAQRNVTIKRLEDARLLTVNRDTFGGILLLDAHPLLREYFAQQLRSHQAAAWRSAHKRLFDHLCDSTPDESQPTLEDLQPLYQAIAHGCQAELFSAACLVFFKRIDRAESYSINRLGAFIADLGALAWFFETPWTRVRPELKGAQAWILGEAAFRQRALGRLMEALQPTEAALQMCLKTENWKAAAVAGGNLSELKLTLGNVTEAVEQAAQAEIYADITDDTFQRIRKRTAHADALFQAGNFEDARVRFREAEQIQSKTWPELRFLYSVMGLQYCSALMAEAERDTWLQMFDYEKHSPHLNELSDVSDRAAQMLRWAKGAADVPVLDFAVSYLIQGRMGLYSAVLVKFDFVDTNAHSKLHHNIEVAVEEFRRAGAQDYLPHGLLTRAWLRSFTIARTGPESAQEDLDEAWEIAERGPMRLHMADIHLYRARLYFREKEYPWESAEADLKAARKLIEECGYWRRKEELEDAERVILKKSL